ncbi:hypothetical protein M0812_03721 [Anaeramoeba flamelloides]|uniref:B30.2/SPRY domain-containing protein n=1 Tax=Anaeramoeba flamelloides TaxID=1746091 RepID=A0AAV8ACV5_9EUKA|nr:hypothetical protein M0812_03721 [Anaeramoeba flamelloides]
MTQKCTNTQALLHFSECYWLFKTSSESVNLTILELFDLANGILHVGTTNTKATESILSSIEQSPNEYFTVSEFEPITLKFGETNPIRLARMEITKKQLLEEIRVSLNLMKTEGNGNQKGTKKKKKKKKKNSAFKVKVYQDLLIKQIQNFQNEQNVLLEKNTSIEEQINWVRSKQLLSQKEHLSKLWKSETQEIIKEQKIDLPIYFNGTFRYQNNSWMDITNNGKTVTCKKISSTPVSTLFAHGKQTMYGEHLFHLKVKIDRIGGSHASNIGITTSKSSILTYKDGWVVDFEGNVCSRDGKWVSTFKTNLKNNSIIGINVDLINGRIGFEWPYKENQWVFNNLDCKMEYVVGVDLWNNGDSVTWI